MENITEDVVLIKQSEYYRLTEAYNDNKRAVREFINMLTNSYCVCVDGVNVVLASFKDLEKDFEFFYPDSE